MWLQGKRREKQVLGMPRKAGRPKKVVAREGEGEGSGAMEQEDQATDGEASIASAEEQVEKTNKESEAAEAREEAKKYGIPGFLPRDLLAQAMPVLLREKMSVRQIVMAVATFIRLTRAARGLTPGEEGSRLSLDDFFLSRSTSAYQKRRRSEDIAADTIEEYTRVVKEGNHPVVVHWDEKMMHQEMEGRADFKARLITCLSSPASPDYQQLLAAAPLDEATGYNVAIETFNQLEGIDVMENVIAAVSDTPSVNFGQENGAMYNLQVLLGKQILEVPCGHHRAELPAKAVQVKIHITDPHKVIELKDIIVEKKTKIFSIVFQIKNYFLCRRRSPAEKAPHPRTPCSPSGRRTGTRWRSPSRRRTCSTTLSTGPAGQEASRQRSPPR